MAHPKILLRRPSSAPDKSGTAAEFPWVEEAAAEAPRARRSHQNSVPNGFHGSTIILYAPVTAGIVATDGSPPAVSDPSRWPLASNTNTSNSPAAIGKLIVTLILFVVASDAATF